MSTGVQLQLTIALCGDLEAAGGLVARELERREPDARIEIVGGLCHAPERAAEVVSRTGADRAVLVVCAMPPAARDFRMAVRKAGLDPFALELVEVGSVPDAETAALLVAAAVARQRAFSGSRPEQLKLRRLSLEHKRSRRSLFTLPPSTYEPVASVERSSCIGEERCGLCISTCPVGAITMAAGKAAVDRDACASCGICVTACPAGAIALPGASLGQYEAELAALLEAVAPRIVFTCRSAGNGTGRAPSPAGWLSIGVPCLGMVTPGWILQALARGATSVALLSCGDACRSGQAARLEERVDYCRKALALLGESSPCERVVLGAPPEAVGASPLEDTDRRRTSPPMLGEPTATARALLALRERYGGPPDLSLLHPGSPLGLVTLREETCTACGACPAACPTGALGIEETAEATAITYDARLCVACGRCVRVCPEAAHDTVGLHTGTRLAALEGGRVTLKLAPAARCRRCGGPIAPDAMLRRIRDTLAEDAGAKPLLDVLTGLCVGCRGLETSTGHPAEHWPS